MAINSLSVGPEGISIGGGGISSRKAARNLRKQYEYRDRYAGRGIEAQVQGYQEAGIHPLFGLGASAGQSPVFSMPGQAETGSHADVGIQIASEAAKKEIEAATKNQELRNELLQIEIDKLKKTGGGNDIDPQAILKQMQDQGSAIIKRKPVVATPVQPKPDPTEGVIELKPAEQLTNAPGEKQTLSADMSLRRRLFYRNDKFIWIPNVQELDALLEEPMTAAGLIAAMNPDLTFKQALTILQGQDLKLGPPVKYKVLHENPFFKIYKGKP